MSALAWVRLASGNYAAFNGEGWFYLVGRLGRNWFLEAGPAEDPKTTDASYGYKTRADAYFEAGEQEEVAQLLCGKYRLDRQSVTAALREARAAGAATLALPDGRFAVVGTDAGGYTVDARDMELPPDECVICVPGQCPGPDCPGYREVPDGNA